MASLTRDLDHSVESEPRLHHILLDAEGVRCPKTLAVWPSGHAWDSSAEMDLRPGSLRDHCRRTEEEGRNDRKTMLLGRAHDEAAFTRVPGG